MKRFIDRKHTVNFALIIVAVIGIVLGAFIAVSGNNMTKVKPAQLEESYGGDGSARVAAFGADFYTYIYDATRKAASSAGSTAQGVQIANRNMQKIVDAQCKTVKTVGEAVKLFGLFTAALFLCIGCMSVKINPCYVYDESKDKRYQKRLEKVAEKAAKKAAEEQEAAQQDSSEEKPTE